MKNIKSLALVGVLTVVGAVAAHAQVLNGNFTANAAGFTVAPGYVDPYSAGNPTAITDWAFYNAGANVLRGINGAATTAGDAFGPTATGGRTYAFIQGENSALYQNLALTPSTTYTLSIDIAGRAGDAAPAFSVEFADATTAFAPFWVNGGFGPALPAGQAAFTTYVLNFTTPGALAGFGVLIELWNRSTPGDNTVDFANVSVTAVPEPTAAALAGIGIVMAGAGRWARRRIA